MKLASGGDLRKALKALSDGEVLELTERGVYGGASLYGHAEKITIHGNGATIRGGSSGLKFERVPWVDVSDLLLTEANIGLVLTQCGGYAVRTVQAIRNRIHGILTANTSYGLIENCNCSESKEQHGIYLSQSCDDVTVRGNTCRGNHRAGIQVNAVQPGTHPGDPLRDSISRDIHLLGNILDGNQAAGGAGLNLAGVVGGTIVGNQILDHLGRAGVALWADGTGKAKFACRDVDINGNTFDFAPSAHPEACISAREGCRGIRVGTNTFPAGITEVVHDEISVVIRG